MIRLSEALARLHCDDIVRPTYVREAFRLLRKSIIHVETEDVTFDDEVEETGKDGQDSGDEDDDDDGNENGSGGKVAHTGEYNPEVKERTETETYSETLVDSVDDSANVRVDQQEASEPPTKRRKKSQSKKKKTQITFEQFNAISSAISTYLRDKEDEKEGETKYLTWAEVADWYLEQIEKELGDSMEEFKRMTKLVDLVIRRLLTKEHTLIYIGGEAANEGIGERERKIAVHPNYEGK
jgi:DNA replication licensing factor MCM6